jgi:DNA-binding response OmpR family regulator
MKKRILIVGDNSKILEILELYLRHLGYEPILAKNTREGLRKARIVDPTIIILDYSFPMRAVSSSLRSSNKVRRPRALQLLFYQAWRTALGEKLLKKWVFLNS